MQQGSLSLFNNSLCWLDYVIHCIFSYIMLGARGRIIVDATHLLVVERS